MCLNKRRNSLDSPALALKLQETSPSSAATSRRALSLPLVEETASLDTTPDMSATTNALISTTGIQIADPTTSGDTDSSSDDSKALDRQPGAPQPRSGQDSFYVRCPGCDSETSIRWNKLQLGRVLECPHCKGNFTMSSSGEIYEIVRDFAGRWKSRAAIDAQRESRRNRRYQIIGGVAATVMVIAISFGTTIRSGNGSPAALPKLPEEFEARVELFTRAWLTGDARTMKRLTDPAHDRQFFPWQRQNQPPLKIKPESLNDDVVVVVEITKLPSTPPVSWVQTKIDGLKLEGTDYPIELRLAWEERAGKWFFQPTR